MPYIEKRITCGRVVEIEKHYSARYKKKGIERGPIVRPTKEEQEIVNQIQAERKLRRLINTNFKPNDYHIVLDYRPEERPADNEQHRDDARKFLRKLRNEYKKAGKELKYIHVMEIGSRGARHHHLVINNIDPRVLTKVWKKGRVKINPLDNTGQYKKLASYLMKYSSRMLKEEGRIQGKRWNPSKNLEQPKVEVTKVSHKKWYREEAIPAKGYYIEKDSVKKGINPYTGWPYFRYTMIRLDEEDSKEKKRSRGNEKRKRSKGRKERIKEKDNQKVNKGSKTRRSQVKMPN